MRKWKGALLAAAVLAMPLAAQTPLVAPGIVRVEPDGTIKPAVIHNDRSEVRVRIYDVFGMLVWDTTASAPLIPWYGTNNSGRRVDVGQYYVVAWSYSQGSLGAPLASWVVVSW